MSPRGMKSSAHSEEGQAQVHQDGSIETVEGNEVQEVDTGQPQKLYLETPRLVQMKANNSLD